MRKKTFTITIHQNQGIHEPFACEVTESKLNKIIDLVLPEVRKKQKKMSCTSVKLDDFFY